MNKMMVSNGALYFASIDNSGIHRLYYTTDGTTITRVSEGNLYNPYIWISFDNELYFTATDSTGYEKLYKTNGITVVKVMNLNSGSHDFDLLKIFFYSFNYSDSPDDDDCCQWPLCF